MTATTAPSRTASLAAVARAVHLFHHGPRALLADWLAWPLVGAPAEAIAAAGPRVLGDCEQPFVTWFAARARITEDWFAASAADQYVILGAGLDSYAWRQDRDVHVFEVDQPGSQQWKRRRVEALRIPIPETLSWLPVDFADRALRRTLDRAGLDHTGGLFVSCLGVVPYLTLDAFMDVLNQLPPCELAITYVPPEEEWDAAARPPGEHFLARVRELGEPWLTLLSRDELAALLAETGFALLEDVGAPDVEGIFGLPAVHHERIARAVKRRSAGGGVPPVSRTLCSTETRADQSLRQTPVSSPRSRPSTPSPS